MARTAGVRFYQPIWETLKVQSIVCLQLQPLSMTAEQAERAAKGYKRSISKEKYEDIMFKDKYPTSRLEFDFNNKTYVLTVTLISEPAKHQLEIL